MTFAAWRDQIAAVRAAVPDFRGPIVAVGGCTSADRMMCWLVGLWLGPPPPAGNDDAISLTRH